MTDRLTKAVEKCRIKLFQFIVTDDSIAGMEMKYVKAGRHSILAVITPILKELVDEHTADQDLVKQIAAENESLRDENAALRDQVRGD